MVDDNAVKDRLYNLGYGDADYNAWTDQTLTDAIKAFQKDHQLNDSGIADDPTRQRIKEMHGS
jgi:peptidoglycan hydrolase-like protein with peptidoglycan-binding domain